MKRFLVNFASVGALSGALLAHSSEAADVSAYSARKGQLFNQSSAAAPTAGMVPYLFVAYVEGDLDSIMDATISTPSPFLSGMPLSPNDGQTRLEFSIPADQNTLNLFAPAGQYSFTVDSDNDGFTLAPIFLNDTVFPTAIPHITNFEAAQAINPDADFTLTFNAFAGAGPNDRFEFELSDGFSVFFAETGTGTSVVIPAGSLSEDESYTARLRFVKESARDTTTYPGAVGTSGLFNETEFSISTGGGGGGENDTTPPTLAFTSPQSGATDVPVNGSVTFVFDEEMAPAHSIQWSANVNASGLSYTWFGEALMVASRGAFPPNETITWRLNPTPGSPGNFRDRAGNELAGTYQGTFTTGEAGSVDPCDPNGGEDDGSGFGMANKSVFYEQTGNNAPVLDADLAAAFQATYRAATNHNVTAVSVTGPNGTVNLANMFGFYFATEDFDTPALLDAAFPSGNYTINATGAGTGTLTLGNTTAVPVPRIENLVQLMGMDVTKDFTLRFAPFTGAGAQDGIFINISGDQGQGEFSAPDICRNIELPNTATSVVIPANTFRAGKSYSGSISFSRTTFDTNAIPNTSVMSSVSILTSFEFESGGGTPSRQPMWTGPARNQDGTLTYTLTADNGTTVVIEGTDALGGAWTPVTTQTLANGSYQFAVDPRTGAKRFFRARVQ